MKNNIDKNKIAILLAGGDGKNFWPISDSKTPEQFVHLIDNKTLFQKSTELIAPLFNKNNIYLVINKDLKQLAISQTNIIEESNICLEPMSKQTAPALGLALMLIDDKYDDNSIICIFPTDQLIKNTEEYYNTINIACEAASELDALITIGITPDRPVTEFGYIQFAYDKNDKKNAKISKELFNKGIRKSINFAEKPDLITAKRFINSNDFVWNSGILIAKKSELKNTFKKHLNYYYEKFKNIKKILGTKIYKTELENLYMTFNKVSIDYGILENAENIYVIKASFIWNDINSWKEFHRVEMKDALDNILLGNIVAINTENTLAISNDKLVAVMGLNDIVVVNTEKAILVCKKSESDKIDELVNFIKKANISLY